MHHELDPLESLSLGPNGPGPDLVRDALRALRKSYAARPFFTGRDVLYTLQLWMMAAITKRRLELSVYADHVVEREPTRLRRADLALVDARGRVDVALEFRWEPDHRRPDMPTAKLPQVSWKAVLADAARVRRWVKDGRCDVGMSVLLDEAGYYRIREAPRGMAWQDWLDTGGALLGSAVRRRRRSRRA